MKRVAAGVLVAGAAVALLGLALGWWEGETHKQPARLFGANATLSTRAVSFGDPLGARLDLLLDPAAIQPDSIHVRTRFDPYKVTGSSVHRARGDGLLISYRWQLECLEQACLPQGPANVKRFTPVVVSFRTRDGGPGITQVDWPTYRLSSWLRGTEAEQPAQRLRFDATVPPPTYRISPGTLQALLAALCALLAVAAGVLFWLGLRRRPEEGPRLSALERAIAAVRASSANGHVGERRRALGWLGRELGAVEEADLARGASRLAWSRPEPSGDAARALADDVEERQ